jgi:hypothetical protein
MKHLSRIELLDMLEEDARGARPAGRRRHLDACEACRTEVAALRATLAEARDDAAAEPSPLFWDHFAARVSAAIRDEAPPVPVPARRWPFERLTAAWTVAALVVVLGMTTVVWRATLHAPTPVADAAGERAPQPPAVETREMDQAWSNVRAAADNLQWDDVQTDGLNARPGTAERVVMEMTAEERAELARLLESEMKRSGA